MILSSHWPQPDQSDSLNTKYDYQNYYPIVLPLRSRSLARMMPERDISKGAGEGAGADVAGARRREKRRQEMKTKML